MDCARSGVPIGVIALASLWLLAWPEGGGVPTSSAQEAKSSPQIWTVPEIGALPNDANRRLVRGGREVDGDAPGRQRQARGNQRRAHALAGLGDGLVGQAHDVERREARRDLNLDIDGAGLDALERHGGDALNHAAPACSQ